MRQQETPIMNTRGSVLKRAILAYCDGLSRFYSAVAAHSGRARWAVAKW